MGRFYCNQRAGYVLKPASLCSKDKVHACPCARVCVCDLVLRMNAQRCWQVFNPFIKISLDQVVAISVHVTVLSAQVQQV